MGAAEGGLRFLVSTVCGLFEEEQDRYLILQSEEQNIWNISKPTPDVRLKQHI